MQMRAHLVGSITSPEARTLQWAIDWSTGALTIPPYVCALYSIEPGATREAVEDGTDVTP